MCQLPAAACPTAGAAPLGPVRAQQAEVLTDRLGVTGSLEPAGGFSGPAVLFRTLPVTPVATRVWLSQTAGSFLVTSRCCADFRPYLEGGALPRATYHPLAVRPSNGYPSLGPLPNAPSRSAGQTASGEAYNDCPSGEDWTLHPTMAPDRGVWPHMGGCPGDPKKWPKLSRLGELLNTQKNVHFLALRGGAPPGSPKVHPGRPPVGRGENPPFLVFLFIYRPGMGLQTGPPGGCPGGCPGGRPGRPGAPGPPPARGGKFSPARSLAGPPARGAPGGVPGGCPRGCPRRGVQTPVRRCHKH